VTKCGRSLYCSTAPLLHSLAQRGPLTDDAAVRSVDVAGDDASTGVSCRSQPPAGRRRLHVADGSPDGFAVHSHIQQHAAKMERTVEMVDVTFPAFDPSGGCTAGEVQAQCEIKVVPQFANAETTDNLVDLFGSTETFIEILDAVEAAGDFADAADAVRHLTEETPNALSPSIESAIDKTNPDNLDSGLAPKNLAELAAKLKTMAEGHDVGWEVYVKLNWSICAWGCIHNSWEPHPAKAWTKDARTDNLCNFLVRQD